MQAVFSAFGGKAAPVLVCGWANRERVDFGFRGGVGGDEGEAELVFTTFEGFAFGVGLPGVLGASGTLAVLDVFDEVWVGGEIVFDSVNGPAVGGCWVVGVVGVGEEGVVVDEVDDDSLHGSGGRVAVGEFEAFAFGADGSRGGRDGFEEVFGVVVNVLWGKVGAGRGWTFESFCFGHDTVPGLRE